MIKHLPQAQEVSPEERVLALFTLLHLENNLVSIITKRMHLKLSFLIMLLLGRKRELCKNLHKLIKIHPRICHSHDAMPMSFYSLFDISATETQ